MGKRLDDKLYFECDIDIKIYTMNIESQKKVI